MAVFQRGRIVRNIVLQTQFCTSFYSTHTDSNSFLFFSFVGQYTAISTKQHCAFFSQSLRHKLLNATGKYVVLSLTPFFFGGSRVWEGVRAGLRSEKCHHVDRSFFPMHCCSSEVVLPDSPFLFLLLLVSDSVFHVRMPRHWCHVIVDLRSLLPFQTLFSSAPFHGKLALNCLAKKGTDVRNHFYFLWHIPTTGLSAPTKYTTKTCCTEDGVQQCDTC